MSSNHFVAYSHVALNIWYPIPLEKLQTNMVVNRSFSGTCRQRWLVHIYDIDVIRIINHHILEFITMQFLVFHPRFDETSAQQGHTQDTTAILLLRWPSTNAETTAQVGIQRIQRHFSAGKIGWFHPEINGAFWRDLISKPGCGEYFLSHRETQVMIQVKKNGSFFRGRTQHMLMLSTSLVVDAHSAPCMIWICGCISSNVQLPVVEDHLPISCQQGETKLLTQLETLSWTGSLHLFFGGLTHSFFNGGQVRSLEFNGSGTERGVCSSISSIFDDCLHVQYMTPKKSKPRETTTMAWNSTVSANHLLPRLAGEVVLLGAVPMAASGPPAPNAPAAASQRWGAVRHVPKETRPCGWALAAKCWENGFSIFEIAGCVEISVCFWNPRWWCCLILYFSVTESICGNEAKKVIACDLGFVAICATRHTFVDGFIKVVLNGLFGIIVTFYLDYLRSSRTRLRWP